MECSIVKFVRHNKHVDPKKNNKLQNYCTVHGKWQCDGKIKNIPKTIVKEEPKQAAKPVSKPTRWEDED